ncbi:SEC14 family lipid-binding protein [Rhodotorula paludigena]|uniref:SEC14 family lipid-binding protein n=1 Tax=Rhodotorula paludigena TaxID=86838 RepID=UPI003179E807
MPDQTPAAEDHLEPVSSRSLAGHVGHLTPQQEETLQKFKDELAKNGYYTPEASGKPASHEDVTLVRFLRARKFDLQGAYAQFTSAEDWRRKDKVDELYDTFDVDEYELGRQLYPQWTGRRDNSGMPVYVFKVSALTKQKTDAYAKDPSRLEPRMIALYENMMQFVIPLCTSIPHQHNETPVSGSATIVDVSNVGLMRFWALKEHMQRASTLANARYAETLGAVYLVGAPSFFSTVWGWVKKWFDPGTVAKIHILSSSELVSVLSSQMPASSIPRDYGGTLDWSFGAPAPALDQPARDALGLHEGEEIGTALNGPVRWKDGRVVLLGKGRSEEQVKRWASQPEKEEPQPQEEKAQEAPTPADDVVASPAPVSPAPDAPSPAATSPVAPSPAPPTPAPEPTAAELSAAAAAASSASSSALPPPILGAGIPNAPSSSTPSSAPSASPAPAAANGHANGSAAVDHAKKEEGEEEKHDIHVAARENPAAPVKDLAAALEGTTL